MRTFVAYAAIAATATSGAVGFAARVHLVGRRQLIERHD
jgi:hypothetical protein